MIKPQKYIVNYIRHCLYDLGFSAVRYNGPLFLDAGKFLFYDFGFLCDGEEMSIREYRMGSYTRNRMKRIQNLMENFGKIPIGFSIDRNPDKIKNKKYRARRKYNIEKPTLISN